MSRYTLQVYADQWFETVEVRAILLAEEEPGVREKVATSIARFYDVGSETDPMIILGRAVAQWSAELSESGRTSATHLESTP